jgi:hypothetical protein
VPAIGGTSHVRSPPSVRTFQELLLPPSPIVPNPLVFPPFVKIYEVNPESLLPVVIENLTVVAHAWCIDNTTTTWHHTIILGPGKSINLPSSTSQDPLTLIWKSALEVLTVLRELEETCRLPLNDDTYDAQRRRQPSRG